ncbi:MAG TPA: DUF5666 domain-containing protein [Candidatus Saccharimonadales bacterium]|nr:DUF5666 domain-containing protein [Candidatus Saccharimonadales bacterium]
MPMHEYQKQMYTKIAVVAALIILPIAGFFAGTLYQKQMTPTNATNGPRQFTGGPRMLQNRAIGTVKSVSDTSITVTNRMDNTDKTYTLSSSTTYKNGESSAKLSDIKAGDTVMLELDANDSTKVVGVTLNPTTMFRGGPEGGSTDMMVQ